MTMYAIMTLCKHRMIPVARPYKDAVSEPIKNILDLGQYCMYIGWTYTTWLHHRGLHKTKPVEHLCEGSKSPRLKLPN